MSGEQTTATADTPQVLLEHHLKQLRLPTFDAEWQPYPTEEREWRRSKLTGERLRIVEEFVASQTARNFDLNIEKILEGWETKHAIRELIANALDEQVLSGTQAIEIDEDTSGNWHIRDFGRGLRYEDLTQNESPEKLNNAGKVIGKFGVGPKDALATLNRRGVSARIASAHCEISLTEAPKHDFEDVVTLQAAVVPSSSPDMAGTDFELQGIAAADIKAAKDFFLCFSGERVLDATPHGQILERAVGRDARVYVTGLLVAEEERFAFSYNITSLTTAMR